MLASWGYEAAVAYDGAEALRAARAQRPRVVLSVLVLPGLDGCGLAACLRAELPGAALVAVTTQGRPADRLRSREAGFCGHLVKPADPDRLRALLAALAGWRQDQCDPFPKGPTPAAHPPSVRPPAADTAARGEDG
jgi:CheY-like chemotaxis protein